MVISQQKLGRGIWSMNIRETGSTTVNGTTSLSSVSVNSDRLRQHAEQRVAQTAMQAEA